MDEISKLLNDHSDFIDESRLRLQLKHSKIWGGCYWQSETDSTNLLAVHCIDTGLAAQGLLIGADRQSSGRGRRGRIWQSPGGGLWLSLVWRPELPRRQWPLLSLLAAVSATAALRKWYPGIGLKWPNDVYADGHKLVGILGEEHNGVLILGIGVNINNVMLKCENFTAVSLAELYGQEVDPTDVLLALIQAFEQRYLALEQQGLSGFLAEYQGLCLHRGKRCKLLREGAWLEGTDDGIDEDGRLRLNIGGQIEHISTGEVLEIEGW